MSWLEWSITLLVKWQVMLVLCAMPSRNSVDACAWLYTYGWYLVFEVSLGHAGWMAARVAAIR